VKLALNKLPRPRRGPLRTHPNFVPEPEWMESGRYVHHVELSRAVKRLFLNRPAKPLDKVKAPQEYQEAFPGLFAELRQSVHIMRGEFDKANWDRRWSDACRRHEDAWRALERAYEAPLARIGKKVRDAPRNRERDKDREDFLQLALVVKARQPDLEQADLLKDPSLAPYLREYPEQSKRWASKIYPPRGRGRPRK